MGEFPRLQEAWPLGGWSPRAVHEGPHVLLAEHVDQPPEEVRDRELREGRLVVVGFGLELVEDVVQVFGEGVHGRLRRPSAVSSM